jgi:hypothetical protein
MGQLAHFWANVTPFSLKWMLSLEYDSTVERAVDIPPIPGHSVEGCIPVYNMYTPLVQLDSAAPTATDDGNTDWTADDARAKEAADARFKEWSIRPTRDSHLEMQRPYTCKNKDDQVRETPRWPTSCSNSSLSQLHSHRNARANSHHLARPNTLPARSQQTSLLSDCGSIDRAKGV